MSNPLARLAAFLILMLPAAPPAATADECADAEAARQLAIESAYQAIDGAHATAGLVPAEHLRVAQDNMRHMYEVIQLLLVTNANLKESLREREAESR